MRHAGLVGITRRRYRCTTDSRHDHDVAANVVQRNFDVTEPNRVWVADVTYVWTWEGWLYLAAIVDLFSRRVVGWATADHMRTELVLEALARATGERTTSSLLVHHSDRGSQYASDIYRHVLAEHGITANAICPGYVRTPLVEGQIADQAKVHGIPAQQVVEKIMLEPAAIKRLLEPEEIAGAVRYLCSDLASGITGAALTVDQGWTAR